MLGWWIVVSEGQPDDVMIDKANTLASWEAGLSGLRWLNDPVRGKPRRSGRGRIARTAAPS